MSPSPQPAATARLEFDPKTMKDPVFLSGPVPRYTQEALRTESQGVVVTKCVVTVNGEVANCRVLESFDPSMGQSVKKALEQRRYTPAMKDGKPVEVEYTFKATFRVAGKGPPSKLSGLSNMCLTLGSNNPNPDGLAVLDKYCFCYRGLCVGQGTPEHTQLLRVKVCREAAEAHIEPAPAAKCDPHPRDLECSAKEGIQRERHLEDLALVARCDKNPDLGPILEEMKARAAQRKRDDEALHNHREGQ